MLSSGGFDLWADGYDRAVGLSDENGTYPFAGYRELLNRIYSQVLSGTGRTVLDIGFGTGALTSQLYAHGCRIYGMDFSREMIAIAAEKMPEACLLWGDFSHGLAPELADKRYDAIIATYSLHHLTDEEKAPFLKSLLPLLNPGGWLLVGDVAFGTRQALEECREAAGDDWDDDENYFVYEELAKALPELEFEQISDCAGLLKYRCEEEKP